MTSKHQTSDDLTRTQMEKNRAEYIYGHYLTQITCTEWSQPGLHSPGLEPLWQNTTEYIYGYSLTLMTCTEWSKPGLNSPGLEP